MNEGEAEAPRPQSIRPTSINAVRVVKLLEDSGKEAEAGLYTRAVLILEDFEGNLVVRPGGLVVNRNELCGILSRALIKAGRDSL